MLASVELQEIILTSLLHLAALSVHTLNQLSHTELP